MLVFGESGYPVVLFPTSRSRYFQYKDFSFIANCAEAIESGKIKIYCPDGIDADSWYNNAIHPADRVKTHNGYEKVILNEVIPFAQYETGHKQTAVGGCSFGGFHAANFAFRNPKIVSYLFCMGGAYNIKRFIHGYYDDNCYYNNPPDYLPNLRDEKYLTAIRKMGIALGTGPQDFCMPENVTLSHDLRNLGVEHWLDVRASAGHDWHWWKEMFLDYINLIQ
jgi:esterase/lipase superfamily enzyme